MIMKSSLTLFTSILAAISAVNAYFLVGHTNNLVIERLDPVVQPGQISAHVHNIQGGSNFGDTLTTAKLRQSSCSTVPIKEDKSNYWVPHLYFQWKNGSVSSLTGGMVTYYLFSDTPGTTTAFPDDFRMVSGETTLRTYNASSFAQQAVTFLCLDFQGTSTRYNQLPVGVSCPSGIRSQINFPSCWDGKNADSPDHKSHVAFLSTGPDSGTCNDPKFPVTLPRIFLEVYWDAQDWEQHRQDALNPQQPFVFSNGDATGYGYHADFFMGWDAGVLQKAVDNCHCNPSGDPTCCSQAGIFTFEQNAPKCTIDPTVQETVLGTLPALPGNNPITGGSVPQPNGLPTGANDGAVLQGGSSSSSSSSSGAAEPASSSAVASAPPASSSAVASAPPAASSAPASSGSSGSGSGVSGTQVGAVTGSGSGSSSGSSNASSSSNTSNDSSSNSGSGSTKQCKRSRSSKRGLVEGREAAPNAKFRAHRMGIQKRRLSGLGH